MGTPRDHIEEIRRLKFSIGGEPNRLTEDLHQAVKNLSAELYAKDVHFLMELIQNAEDNEYPGDVKPSLEFIITSEDITSTGALATLLVFNNEKGFFYKNIESISSVGRSTKKGNRQRGGYIGEKGIGFKSVFLITSRPYIFSNGYHIRFSEEPLPDCDLGYIVPEWVENPTLSDIQQIYGSNKMLPTTTIILPLKSEKVGAVKQQLSSIHPEVLLFLSKIKRLSVREHNKDPNLNTVSAISISSETDFRTRKNVDAESYTLHLSAEEKGNGGESNYYMWKQRFPVKQENRVERRNEVEELVITLAFPYGQRLNSRHSSPGIYAFLPTEMVTNFPFIIQADFVLASSRETILLDNIWNKGILDCVPSAFVNAFISLVKTESAPLSSLPPIFEFLPVKPSSYPELNAVRGSIKAKVIAEHIIPCETYTEQKIFCKPEEVGRIVPAFWNILIKARSQGLSLETLSSHGRYILNYAFDNAEYNTVLEFLEVKEVGYGWYAKCIESSNLVMGITEDVYIELLCFLADNWRNCFSNSDVKKILLLKYVDHDYKVSLWSINSATQSSQSICLSSEPDQDSWLISWNGQFKCAAGRFFIPKSTQEALRSFPRRVTVMDWLRQHAGIDAVNVNGYGKLTISALSNRSLVIAFAHFLYHSLSKCFLSELEVSYLCNSMPLVNSYGHVVPKQNRVLVPAKDSNWLELMGSNLWGNYVELGLDYFRKGHFAGVYSSERELMKFLKTYIKASDIPQLCPPNAVFPAVSSRLTKQNSFLLLDWIRNLKREKIEMPEKFLRCVKEGSWVKTSIGYKPPSESFLSSSAWGNLLQVGSISVDIPLIDQGFYDFRISQYKEELQAIGVMFEFGEACSFIGKHLMSLAASSSLTRSHVLSMLQFIKFLSEKYLSPEEFICSVKEGSWLKTSHGFRSPVGSVLFDAGWKAASEISNLPFIDAGYYGKDILEYRTELDLMGVVVGFRQNYQLVADYFRLPTDLTSLTADSVHLILECIRQARSSKQLAIKLKDHRWLKTNLGYKLPAESFLFDPKWGCLLKVVDAIPLIDENFYGSKICSYKNELKDVGIVVCFDEASKAIARHFKHLAFSSCVTKENVHSLLACYKHLKDIGHQFPRELTNCIYEEKWLRTRLGYKSPKESILFNSEWESIAPIAFLPFIDDIFYGKGIYECKDVLKDFGAVVEFKQGSRFVGSSLNIPETACEVTPANVLSLLKCIRYLQEQMGSLPKELMSKVSKKWLKTLMGYQSPDKCILFDSKWSCLLQPEDGPFIDEAFYGSEITSYREELKLIGVTMEAERGCSLLADHLECHINFTVITRIYKYLNNYKWEPDNTSASWIWIPNGRDKGDWVSPKDCVIHDKENLFSSQLHVLDKYYEKELLHFFYMTLNVRNNPTIDSYFKLWKDWEKEQRQLTLAECSAVWVFFAKHWSSNTEKLLTESMEKMEKIPASTLSGEIRLIDKQDVFIPDDLQLKDLFDKASAESLFVWYPQSSLASLSQTKLYDIYSSIGVRTISESIQKDESSNVAEFKKVNPKEALLRNGLFRIILGFLADPSLEMNTERRHQIVGYLRDLSVYETAEPITISYSLPLSSGKRVSIKASQMVRWERENSRLFIQKVGRSTCHKANIEFASYFSEAISEGLLWENTDQIAGLSELIKLGCLLEFEEDAVKFLLRTKNLQLFVEDEQLVSSTVALD